jgi:hypothetical protein
LWYLHGGIDVAAPALKSFSITNVALRGAKGIQLEHISFDSSISLLLPKVGNLSWRCSFYAFNHWIWIY